MDKVVLKARAKINLGLDVIRKREDGYHDVRMIMQSLALYDRVEMEKMDDASIVITTNRSYLPTNEDNLMYKAAKLMMDTYHIQGGVRIALEKMIPVAAGMAGGSSDAAAVLVGMNQLYNLGVKQSELMELGVKIGADVPFCILRGTALSEGIGEKLRRVASLPSCPILIAKPGINVSTKFVYENLKLNEETVHPDIDGMIAALQKNDLDGVCGLFGNVLESVTINAYPIIADIKQKMIEMGAKNSLMSGSGPTVFGIFNSKDEAYSCANALKESGLAKQVFVTDVFCTKKKKQPLGGK